MKSLQLTKPHLIVIVGIPGSGKTFFASQFSKTFSAPFLNYLELHTILGGNDATTTKVWDYTLERLCMTHQTVIIEGPGESHAARRHLMSYAHSHGYQPLFVWVQTEPTTAETRATKGTPGQKGQVLMSMKDFQDAVKHFQALSPSEPYMVISGKHTYASQAKNVLKKLVAPRAEHIKAKSPVVKERTVPRAPQRSGRIRID